MNKETKETFTMPELTKLGFNGSSSQDVDGDNF